MLAAEDVTDVIIINNITIIITPQAILLYRKQLLPPTSHRLLSFLIFAGVNYCPYYIT